MFSKKKECAWELKRRNPKAIEYVIDEYGNLLYKVIYSVLGNFKDEGYVEECINDVLLSIWQNIDKFSGDDGKFKSWICAIARFKAIDFMRKRHTEVTCELIDNVTLFSKEGVEDTILVKEHREELLAVINEMGELDKSIFVKKYFLGASAEEIGEELGITKGNVNTRLCRGRKVLKDKFQTVLVEVL